jgi:hypothetical protein
MYREPPDTFAVMVEVSHPPGGRPQGSTRIGVRQHAIPHCLHPTRRSTTMVLSSPPLHSRPYNG